jgi:hypothetical protein
MWGYHSGVYELFICFLVTLSYPGILMIEAVRSSETSANLHWTSRIIVQFLEIYVKISNPGCTVFSSFHSFVPYSPLFRFLTCFSLYSFLTFISAIFISFPFLSLYIALLVHYRTFPLHVFVWRCYLFFLVYFLINEKMLMRSPCCLSAHPPQYFLGLMRTPCSLCIPL